MPETLLKKAQVSIIVGSVNPVKLNAVNRAMSLFFDSATLVMTAKDTPSGVSDQPIGIEETKRGALNRMRGSIPTQDLMKSQMVVVGLENGLIPGKELSTVLPGQYFETHWYDLGIVAVTVFNQGSAFTYVSYASPLQIPNDETLGMLPPDHVDGVAANLEKYRANIIPLLQQKNDLYALFSKNLLSREDTLFNASRDALERLLNVHSYRANQPIQAVDTVVTFGCFDLFHPLHQRLIDNASIIGKQVIVYVYNKEYKKKGDQLVRLTNNVQHRITNVIEYATKNNIKITAVRMEGKHLPALRKAISSWSLRGSVAVFGGDDQFADYPELLDLCYTMKTPIVSISRGDIKGKLCSSDIREQQSYQRLAAIYHIDLAQVSPAFWKKRIHSLVQAKEYLKKQANLGAGTVDILKFNPTWPVDQRITKPVQSNDKLVICLPGRTPSTLDRVRKILLTMEQLIPAPLVDTVQRYLICYEDNGQNTRDYIDALAQNPYDFFSDEAMEIVRCLIMPRVSQAISIRSEERGWCVNKTSEFARKPWPEILQDLTQVTLWARSRGSVLLIEIENAFRYCMLTLDYSEDEIGIAAQCIGAVAISNLAPLSRDRLFSTISVTGINDKVAQSYIPDLLEIAHSKISQSSIDITMSAINHCVVIAQIPSQIITDEGTLIYDEKCHYTPLYMSLRQSEDANTLPLLVREAMGKMISREKPFDFEEIKQPVSETLCSRVAAPHY